MKKFIEVLVTTAILCSFVSCGQDNADEITEESSVTSITEVTENSTEKTTESENAEVNENPEETDGEEITGTYNETEDKTELSETLSADGNYEDAIKMLLECMNNNDTEGMIKLSFPDKYIDLIKPFMEVSGSSLDEMITTIKEAGASTRLVEIVSAEAMATEDINILRQMHGKFELINQYIEQNGKDNIDEEKLKAFITPSSIEDLPSPYFEVSDGQFVKCILEYEYENGETANSELDLIMYHIDGEGWKIDMSLMSYMRKAKQSSMNSFASMIINASNASIIDLDKQGVELPEIGIISSDHSKNYNVSEDFANQFESCIQNYYSEYQNIDCFIVIKNGAVDYVVTVKPDDQKCVGTYPANSIYSADGEHISKDNTYTFDELYNMCLEQIQ